MSWSDYLQSTAFQRAFLAAIIGGGCLSLLGVVIVMLKLTVIRFTLMHLALLGGALGLVFGMSPLSGAAVAIAIGSLALGPLSSRFRTDPSLVGAALMTGSVGLAFILFYKTGIPAAEVFGLFTGSLLTLSQAELYAIIALSVVTAGLFMVCYREIQLLLYEEEQAEWLGLNTGRLKQLLLLLTGFAIGSAMKMAGALMIDAIILLPAMAALPWAGNLWTLLLTASGFGVATAAGGLVLAILFDLPVGASITVTGVALLVMSHGSAKLFK